MSTFTKPIKMRFEKYEEAIKSGRIKEIEIVGEIHQIRDTETNDILFVEII